MNVCIYIYICNCFRFQIDSGKEDSNWMYSVNVGDGHFPVSTLSDLLKPGDVSMPVVGTSDGSLAELLSAT